MNNIQAAKPKPVKNKKYMMVRYGRMNALGFFEHNEAEVPKVPMRVVIKTERGLELGHLVGQLGCYKAGACRLSRSQARDYFQDSEIDLGAPGGGRFIRFATAEDVSEEKHLASIASEEMAFCKKLAKDMKLPMKVIDVDHIFGGERIIFYFMSETRVDFRDLVKKIAHEYQTRIEMRQIGLRDEAQLLGDYETCGQECCCKKFLKALKPVNMRMAKMQKATLDPSKISGYCGRLKCCLRYEDETYTELKRRLPRKNARVRTAQGEGRVIDGQILTQLVMVEYADGKRAAVPLEEMDVLDGPGRDREPRPLETRREKIEYGAGETEEPTPEENGYADGSFEDAVDRQETPQEPDEPIGQEEEQELQEELYGEAEPQDADEEQGPEDGEDEGKLS